MDGSILNIYKLKGINCKIKKNVLRIFFQRRKYRNKLEKNSPLLKSSLIIEEKNRKIHWR